MGELRREGGVDGAICSFDYDNEVDTVDAATRSRMMAGIRSKSSLDKMLHNFLKGHKIEHKMHPKIYGSPDALVFPNLLIFVDGCFWHCCPKCGRTPDTARSYWVPKLKKNIRRDRAVSRKLRAEGWSVYREWEHRFRVNPKSVIRRIQAYKTSL